MDLASPVITKNGRTAKKAMLTDSATEGLEGDLGLPGQSLRGVQNVSCLPSCHQPCPMFQRVSRHQLHPLEVLFEYLLQVR